MGYIFNGRFNTTRAWVRACQKLNVSFNIHERTRKNDRFFVFGGKFVHDASHYRERIERFIETSGNTEEIANEGIAFFEEIAQGKNSDWKSFTSLQNKSEMPPSWDQSKRNIAYFASTEREFAGVREITTKGLYENQLEALLDFIPKAIEKDSSIIFYIRIHPNSIHESIRWWEDSKIQSLKNTYILPPESRISTYGLMQACEKTICFRSTMGIGILGKAVYHFGASLL
jgi:hypothetical protein